MDRSNQPRLETNQQNAAKATIRLGLSRPHTDTSPSKHRRVTFDIPSEQNNLPGLVEGDTDVEMVTTQNTPAERTPSFEIMNETEDRASLQAQRHSSGMTFKSEPTEDNDQIVPCVDNVGCFLKSLGLENWISNFHEVGLKTRQHLKKLVTRVNDTERMGELWRLLQSQKVPIAVWWDVLDGLSKVATNHDLRSLLGSGRGH